MDEVEQRIREVKDLLCERFFSCNNSSTKRFILYKQTQVENIEHTYLTSDRNLVQTMGIKENFLGSLDEIEDFIKNLDC